MNSFTIKDLSNLSGIKAHTLRIWEQRYTFLKPNRTDTNIRLYDNHDLKIILNIALLNKYGFKISHIDKMSEQEVNDKILSLNQLQAQQERIVNDLIKNMIDLDIEKFEKNLNQHIAKTGIERTITQIIFPFLEKIGILWVTNHVNPAQEHLVFNIIRQKVISGIEAVQYPVQYDKKMLLFLPEGEHHELGLLFVHFVLKSRGIPVIYLGANVPMKDLQQIVTIMKPYYLYVHLTTGGHNFNFDKFLQQLANNFSHIPVIISGHLTKIYEKKVQPPIQFKRTFLEMMDFIKTI